MALARWLLLARHRNGADELPLTHEFLAMMLAVRRPGVTVATGTFEQAGFIQNRRGIVRIIDVEALEEVSCECYRLIREQELALLGRNPLLKAASDGTVRRPSFLQRIWPPGTVGDRLCVHVRPALLTSMLFFFWIGCDMAKEDGFVRSAAPGFRRAAASCRCP